MMFLAAVLIFAPSTYKGAHCEHIRFEGKAFVDGNVANEKIGLRVYCGTRPVGWGRIKADGSMHGMARVDPDIRHLPFYVLPTNSSFYWEKKVQFWDGVAVLNAGRPVSDLELRLRSFPMKRHNVLVVGPDERPVDGATVHMEISCSKPELPKLRVWEFRSDIETPQRGTFTLPYVEGIPATCLVKIHKRIGDIIIRERQTIKISRSRAELPTRLKMKATSRLSAVLQLQWDAGYSKEPFRPQEPMLGGIRFAPQPPGRYPDGFYISPNRDETRRELFNVPPGDYRLTLVDRPDLLYKIVNGSDVLSIPKESKEVIQHTVFLSPRRQLEISGIVVDAISNDGLPRSTVASGQRATVTDAQGRFSIAGLSGGYGVVNARHSDYFSVSQKIDLESQKELILKLNPYPVLSGQVISGRKKKPSEGVRLELYQRKTRRKTATDDQGRFRIHLAPGDYDLVASKKSKEAGRSLIVFRADITMKEKDYSLDIPAREVGRVDVKVGPFESLVEGRGYKTSVCFVQNKVFWGAALLDENRKATVHIAEGRYDVIIAFGEKKGALVGKVQVSSNGKQSLSLKVGKVADLKFDGKRMTLGK